MHHDQTALLDVNVLVALAWPQHVHHSRAHAWFDRRQSPWATTPITEAGLVRLSTTPAVVGRPVAMSEALIGLKAVRAISGHEFWMDDASLAEPVVDLGSLVSRKQVTDVHLVDLAARREGVLATMDASIVDALEPADRRLVLVLP